MTPEQIESEFENIKQRNRRVELDKKWENSRTRKVFISAIIYLVALVWLLTISEPQSFMKAFVPVAGYILSTLSLPALKNWWIKKITTN